VPADSARSSAPPQFVQPEDREGDDEEHDQAYESVYDMCPGGERKHALPDIWSLSLVGRQEIAVLVERLGPSVLLIARIHPLAPAFGDRRDGERRS
jgi:hypothetical protein